MVNKINKKILVKKSYVFNKFYFISAEAKAAHCW